MSRAALSRTWAGPPARTVALARGHGLDRVDHEQVGAHLVGRGEHPVEIVIGQQEAPDPSIRQRSSCCSSGETIGSQPDLLGRLLGGDDQRPASALGDLHRGLEDEGRLPDAGFATDQHDRPRHEAASENPIELADADGPPDLPAILHLPQRYRFGGDDPAVAGFGLFGERLGEIAAGAKAHPFAGGVAAGTTAVSHRSEGIGAG